MSARFPEDHEQDPVEKPSQASDDPSESATPPITTPRRPRRRVDPDGDTLHTGSTAQPRPNTTDETAVEETPADATTPKTTAFPTEPFVGAHAAPRQSNDTLLTEPLEDSFVDAASARAKARDRAVVGSPVAARIMQVVLAILAPITILIGIIRLIASPVFLWFEYHRPGFPADQYGMDTEQRMTYGSYGLDYLFNFAPPSYLGELTFANGNPVFAQAEVGHMADVKQVMLSTMAAGLVGAVICLVLIIMLYRMRKGAIARSLFAGAVWFTVAMIVLAVVAAFGWQAFFAGFHQLFFADGTWTFSMTDTLIRLYPGQFWIDAAAGVGGLTLVVMVVIMICTAPTGRRRYRNEQAQRFMESQVMGETETEKALGQP